MCIKFSVKLKLSFITIGFMIKHQENIYLFQSHKYNTRITSQGDIEQKHLVCTVVLPKL
jgi:hypothetical protein